jgi:hypothetical protein
LTSGGVPEFPNSVADEINGTPYLDVGVAGLLGTYGWPKSLRRTTSEMTVGVLFMRAS